MSEQLEQTITLEAAAAYLGMAESTLRKRAAAGVVRGYKPGRRWMFLPSEIAAYMRASRPQHRSITAATLRTDSSCNIERSASQLARQIEGERLALVRGGRSVVAARHK